MTDRAKTENAKLRKERDDLREKLDTANAIAETHGRQLDEIVVACGSELSPGEVPAFIRSLRERAEKAEAALEGMTKRKLLRRVGVWLEAELANARASGDEKLRELEAQVCDRAEHLIESDGVNSATVQELRDELGHVVSNIRRLLSEPAERPTDDEVDAYMAKDGYAPIEKPAQEAERPDADDGPLLKWLDDDDGSVFALMDVVTELARRATGGRKQC